MNKIQQGHGFGEAEIVDNMPRTETYLCVKDSVFAYLSRQDYIEKLQDKQKRQYEHIREFFKTMVFKNAFGSQVAGAIGRDFAKNSVRLKKGEVVFNQDTQDNRLYVLCEGSLILEHTISHTLPTLPGVSLSTHTVRVRTVRICRVDTGEILGEECLFNSDKRIYTARVESDSCLVYSAHKGVVESHGMIATGIMPFIKTIFMKKEKLIRNLLAIQLSNLNPSPRKATPSTVSNLSQWKDTYRTPKRIFLKEKYPFRYPNIRCRVQLESSLHSLYPDNYRESIIENMDGYLIEDRMHEDLGRLHQRLRDYDYIRAKESDKNRLKRDKYSPDRFSLFSGGSAKPRIFLSFAEGSKRGASSDEPSIAFSGHSSFSPLSINGHSPPRPVSLPHPSTANDKKRKYRITRLPDPDRTELSRELSMSLLDPKDVFLPSTVCTLTTMTPSEPSQTEPSHPTLYSLLMGKKRLKG